MKFGREVVPNLWSDHKHFVEIASVWEIFVFLPIFARCTPKNVKWKNFDDWKHKTEKKIVKKWFRGHVMKLKSCSPSFLINYFLMKKRVPYIRYVEQWKNLSISLNYLTYTSTQPCVVPSARFSPCRKFVKAFALIRVRARVFSGSLISQVKCPNHDKRRLKILTLHGFWFVPL